MNTTPSTGRALLALMLLVPAADALAVDNRVIVSTGSYPWSNVASLNYNSDSDAWYEGRGSAMVVGPHMALTCGHCVYNRSAGQYNGSDIFIAPGQYEDTATGNTVYPYGQRLALHKRTNNKYADPAYSPTGNVDYGALQYVCPFKDITTYAPLVFNYSPSYINMSGYPSADLPDPTRNYDQWWDADSVTTLFARRMEYQARSTGGASGAPVWVYNAEDGRRVVGVNYSHSTPSNGWGTRLVWNNQGLILSWLAWEPTSIQKMANGCPDLIRMPWSDLLAYYQNNPTQLMTAQQLRVVAPPPQLGQPARRVVQFIENTHYEWDEFLVDPNQQDGQRYLVMIKPEPHPLPVYEARVLLTASQRWEDQVPSGNYAEVRPPSPEPILPLPQPSNISTLPGPVDGTSDQPHGAQ